MSKIVSPSSVSSSEVRTCFLDGCDKRGDLGCSACSAAWYCSAAHQALDLKGSHGLECKQRAKIASISSFPVSVFLSSASESGTSLGVLARQDLCYGQVAWAERTPMIATFQEVVSKHESIESLRSLNSDRSTELTASIAVQRGRKDSSSQTWLQALHPRSIGEAQELKQLSTTSAQDSLKKEVSSNLKAFFRGEENFEIPSFHEVWKARANTFIIPPFVQPSASILARCKIPAEPFQSGSVMLCGFASLFNHSCAPNCEGTLGWTVNPRTKKLEAFIRVFAIRNIKAGEELCLSYSDVAFNSTEHRKKAMQDAS